MLYIMYTKFTYCDYVYFNNNIDTTNEHYNHFILNHIPHFYITSLTKILDNTFPSFPELFVDDIIKIDESPYQICSSVIKSCKMEQRQPTNRINLYFNTGMNEYVELC